MWRLFNFIIVFGLTLAGIAGFLFHLNTGVTPDPIMLEPFELFPVYWYGVIVVVAIGIGFLTAFTQPAANESSSNHLIWRYLISIVIGGIVGARLFDTFLITPIARMQGITSPRDYFDNPVFLIDFSWGGLNTWGALCGGAIVLFWFCWRTELSRTQTFFKATIGFLIGLSVAQWGHFINQELYGAPLTSWWAIYIDPAHRLPIFAGEERFVPLFLFGAIWYLAGGAYLAFTPRWQRSSFDQLDAILIGLIWFAVGRLMLELATPNSLFNWLPAVALLLIIFIVALNRNTFGAERTAQQVSRAIGMHDRNERVG